MKSSQAWKRWYIETLALNGARLIYQGGDASGPIRVVDLGPYRALYFDSPSCQGRVHRTKPWTPASDYIISMVFGATLSQTHNFSRVLVLGLGPGAIVHTLRKMDAEVQIHSVEVRETVIEVAKEKFDVPCDERITHIASDAATFFKTHKASKSERYDYVIADLAISEGPSPLVTQPAFWTELSRLLTPNGVICINLWRGKEHLFDWTIRQMSKTFNQEPLCVEHKHIENIIAYSSPAPLQTARVKEGLKRLVALGDDLELNVRGGLEFLLRQMMELTPEPEEVVQTEPELPAAPSIMEEARTKVELEQIDSGEERVARVDPYDPSSPPGAIEP